MHFDVSVDDFY